MRRALLLASSLAIIAGTATAQEQITLQFWDNQQTESGLSQFQQAAVDRFEAENPDINVEITTIPYPEYQQRLLTAVQGGNAPDIATLDQIWMGAFAESGSILPLGDLAADAGVEAGTFFPGAWESANYDGTLWGIPFNVDVWFFGFYNQDLFEEAGVDAQSVATWEGLKEAAAKLTGDGQFGIGLFGGRGEDTVVALDSFIFSNGGRVLNEDGSCALGEPAAVEHTGAPGGHAGDGGAIHPRHAARHPVRQRAPAGASGLQYRFATLATPVFLPRSRMRAHASAATLLAALLLAWPCAAACRRRPPASTAISSR